MASADELPTDLQPDAEFTNKLVEEYAGEEKGDATAKAVSVDDLRFDDPDDARTFARMFGFDDIHEHEGDDGDTVYMPAPDHDTLVEYVEQNRVDDTQAKAEAAQIDAVLLRAFERQIMPPSIDAIEKRSWSSDEDVPDFVIGAIEDVVDRGAIFDDFKSLPGRVADTLSDTLTDALTQPQGWSLDSIVDNLGDAIPRADPSDLETVARTESARVLNEARESGYRDRGLDDAKFKWQGPDDSRTTDACDELKDLTNPDYGGEPKSMPELINLERSVSREHFPNLSFRKHTIHPNERHTFVRATGTGGGGIDVDVPSAEDLGERFEDDPDSVPVSPDDFGSEKSVADHDHDDRTFDDVLESVAKATTPTRRMREVENALGAHIPTILRECFEAAGSKEGALREMNRRLVDADEYDHDERGQVSKPTLYEWAARYDTHIDHLV